MPSLKDLKIRIESVKSTRKITSAMKMVAASKFRRAQEQAEATRPYAEAMTRIMTSLTSSLGSGAQGPKLLTGTGQKKTVLLIVVTADRGSRAMLEMFEKTQMDEVYLIYNRFKNVLTQIVTIQQMIPVPMPKADEKPEQAAAIPYEYEPDEEGILADLLPRNVGVQLYRALLESAAGEQGARMTAMDNATRNAGEMIGKLTLQYNRARQAYITKEMIEIVTGAEAV
ncbi:MAG: F0F1 ATP synthase subunit gamma [Proteobacteria bacterium]|nr:F0F1 ATP synthase subunit gamma [Pseudomonadota bacterium]